MSNRDPHGREQEHARANVVVRERHHIKSGFPAHPARGLAEALGEALLKIEAERKAARLRSVDEDDVEEAPSSVESVPVSGVVSAPESRIESKR